MSLRGTAPKRLDCEPLWTLGNQRKDPLDSSGGVYPKGQKYHRHVYASHWEVNYARTAKNKTNVPSTKYRKICTPRLAIIKTLISAVQYVLLNRLHTHNGCLSEDLSPSPTNDFQAGIHKGAASEPLCAPSAQDKKQFARSSADQSRRPHRT